MKRSAGILLFRFREEGIEVLVGHPGGPFWKNRHEGAWSIPKGLVEDGEDPRAAAIREFAEETGHTVDPTGLLELGSVRLSSGKEVLAWGIEDDLDPASITSNPVVIEWPRGTGRMIEFPEIDEVRWATIAEARILLNPGQQPFLRRLEEMLDHTE